MNGVGKWRQVTRGVISPEIRAARLVRMAAAAAETGRVLAEMRATNLAGSPEGTYQDHGKGDDPQTRQVPHGDDASP